MATINERKAESVLNKLVNYSEYVIMTRKQFCEKMFKEGATVKKGTKFKIQYSRTKYNRMNGREQEIYDKQCAEKIVCYQLTPKGVDWNIEITKTEFDFFNTLK
jgi:hypothetical protein